MLVVHVHVAALRRLAASPGPRPEAARFARFQASRGSEVVTSLWHRGISVDAFDRSLLARMDGTRTAFDLADAAVEDATKGLVHVEVDGCACTDRALFGEMTAHRLDALASSGLVVKAAE